MSLSSHFLKISCDVDHLSTVGEGAPPRVLVGSAGAALTRCSASLSTDMVLGVVRGGWLFDGRSLDGRDEAVVLPSVLKFGEAV